MSKQSASHIGKVRGESERLSKTMFEKIWEAHIVKEEPGQPSLMYIDLHLIHEVTSAQAFEGLRQAGRTVRRPELTFATVDHIIPTRNPEIVEDETALAQMRAIERNCQEFGVTLFGLGDPDQGVVHVTIPELGLTTPGSMIVCGDSHTSTHGAFGTLAFGIGTSEVEHVLATQCLRQAKPKTMEVAISGKLPVGVTAKDLILAIIGKYGTDFATGHVIEYTGEVIVAMTMEQRMTVCNMSIEAGARAGMIAPDETTFNYLRGRERAPKGEVFERATERWIQLRTDEGAKFDTRIEFDASTLVPQVTWGTSPGMGAPVTGLVPNPEEFESENKRKAAEKALAYMGIEPGTPMTEIAIDRVFIGSCTNGRIEDLRAAASIAKGRKVSDRVKAMVVPGSTKIKWQAEREGLDRIFIDAGFEWRDSGCSMCLAMNPDYLDPGERCASTSNRNFEGRQGRGSKTHLVSPEMAVAAAIAGHFVDVREWERSEIAVTI